MGWVALGIALAFIVVFWATTRALGEELDRIHGVLAKLLDVRSGGVDAHWMKRVHDLEEILDGLPTKWEAFRDQARAAEERTRGRIRRALESVEEGDDDGLLRLAVVADENGVSYGERGEGGEVQPVRADVAGDPERPEVHEDAWLDHVIAHKYREQ